MLKRWLPIIRIHSVTTKITSYRDIPLHTLSLSCDNNTLPHMTDFWDTYILRLECRIRKYFLKGQAVVPHFKFNHAETLLPSHSSHPMHGKLQTKILSMFASLENYVLC